VSDGHAGLSCRLCYVDLVYGGAPVVMLWGVGEFVKPRQQISVLCLVALV
jgi:hypothetical protein